MGYGWDTAGLWDLVFLNTVAIIQLYGTYIQFARNVRNETGHGATAAGTGYRVTGDEGTKFECRM